MSNKNKLNDEQLEMINGGSDIQNASEKTLKESEKEELERRISQLQQMVSNGDYKSYQEAMELINKITELLRELQGYDDPNPIIRND